MTRIQTEIEQALEIAQKTRNNILSGKKSLEDNIQGFYTVAQILGREEDTVWAESEFRGYPGKLPKYRTKAWRVFIDNRGHQLPELHGDVSCTYCGMGVGRIQRMLTQDPQNRTRFIVSNREIESMDAEQKRAYKRAVGVSWQYAEDSLVDILSFTKFELIKRLNQIIGEMTYGKIPAGVFKKFQEKVNTLLASSNPAAVSELNTAYENMGSSEDSEKNAHVAFSCRRLIMAVSDNLFPAQKEDTMHDGKSLKVTKSNFINRLEAYVDSLESNNRKHLIKKLDLLRDMYGKIPQSINKGIHANISNADAETLVIYSYLILGEILLCRDEAAPKKPKRSRNSSRSSRVRLME